MIRRKFLQLLSLAGVTIPVKLATGSVLPMGQVTTSWNDQNEWVLANKELPKLANRNHPCYPGHRVVPLQTSRMVLVCYKYREGSEAIGSARLLEQNGNLWWQLDTMRGLPLGELPDFDFSVPGYAMLSLSQVIRWLPITFRLLGRDQPL